MNNCQSVREQAMTKSSNHVMSSRKAFPGHPRGKRLPTPLTRKWKVVMLREVKKNR